jgi:hypothetical protein
LTLRLFELTYALNLINIAGVSAWISSRSKT